MATITESIGRSALLAAASNYKSVAEALMELIDNPFDKRRGRRLTIDVTIDKKGDRISILDQGGEGMNEAGLQEWIRWGEGAGHSREDIGQYHVGGKLAAIYLAEHLVIQCRNAGEGPVWQFDDPHWGSRTEALRDTPLKEVPLSEVEWPAEMPRSGVGFACVTLKGLKDHRYDVSRLTDGLSDTYRSLIASSQCIIRINGTLVETLRIPWSSSVDIVQLPPSSIAKIHVSGQIGAIDRDQLADRQLRIPAGIRTEFNGRKITDGEEFRHNLRGRNPLGRLYGEITIAGDGLKPNQLKDGWPRDSAAWTALEEFVHKHMQPVVAHLNSISSGRTTTREEQKWANSAKRRVLNAIQLIGGNESVAQGELGGNEDTSRGRKPPEPSGGVKQSTKNPNSRQVNRQARTPPPEDAVGRLRRLASTLPEVDYDDLGPGSPRTEWRSNDNGKRSIVINRDYPLAIGRLTEVYVFESVAQHVIYEDVTTLREARDMFDQLVWSDKRQQRPD